MENPPMLEFPCSDCGLLIKAEESARGQPTICPNCNTDSLYLSHRRGSDWFIFHIFRRRPVRCSCCCQRFYALLKA